MSVKNGVLKDINEYLDKKIEDMNEKIYDYNKKIRELTEKIDETKSNINKKNKELKEKLNQFPFFLENVEKLMSIIISSKDEKLLYSLPCKNTNTINDIEEEFYKEFPEYSKTKNIFSYKGKIINKFETFQKNKIKNGDILILEQVDILENK